MIGGADKVIQFYNWSSGIMSDIFLYGFGAFTLVAIIYFVLKTKRKSRQR